MCLLLFKQLYRKTSQKNAESLAQHMNDSKIY